MGIQINGQTDTVTATDGSINVGGDVTIPGVLTYEDVTNIDAVGVITARSDVSIADKIIHTGDTNTAIRFPAADTITVETAGSERLRVNSAGNIGIGTDNPLQKLHLLDTASANIYLQTHNAGTGSTAGVYFRTSDSSTVDGFFKTAIVLEDDGTSWARGKLHFLQNNTTDASNATLDDSVLVINNNGNIGIGTDNPGTKLEIHSNTIPRINSVYQGSKHFGMSVGGSGGGFVITDGHFMTVNHQPYADRGTDNNLTERLRISNIGQLTTKGNNQGNPVGIEIRNNNTNAYSHAELALTSQNATTSKIWCDVPNAGMRLNYNGGTSVKINQSGNLVMASGSGIDFSATGNSSGTMTSELLDDYEEGSWTPNFTFNGNSTGLTYSNRGGLYTRVGRLVTCYCMIVLSAKGSSTGNVLVTGLPYTATDLVAGTAIEGGGLAVYQDDTVGTHTGPIQVTVINNQTYFELYRITSTNPGHSDSVTNGNVANNSSYRFVLQYTAV